MAGRKDAIDALRDWSKWLIGLGTVGTGGCVVALAKADAGVHRTIKGAIFLFAASVLVSVGLNLKLALMLEEKEEGEGKSVSTTCGGLAVTQMILLVLAALSFGGWIFQKNSPDASKSQHVGNALVEDDKGHHVGNAVVGDDDKERHVGNAVVEDPQEHRVGNGILSDGNRVITLRQEKPLEVKVISESAALEPQPAPKPIDEDAEATSENVQPARPTGGGTRPVLIPGDRTRTENP